MSKKLHCSLAVAIAAAGMSLITVGYQTMSNEEAYLSETGLTVIALGFFVTVLALVIIALVYRGQSQVDHLQERCQLLEAELEHKRLRHDTLAGLEDGVAVLIGELIEEDIRGKHRQQRLNDLKDILTDTRNMTYDKDRANTKEVTR